MAVRARRAGLLLLALLLGACATTPDVRRIALLAPFEGSHREIGYQALYAARMAIDEANEIHLELLAVDDGGTFATAQDRARALSRDPLVEAVILLGPHPTDQSVTELFRPEVTQVIVGSWNSDRTAFTAPNPPETCDDLCALTIFAVTAEQPNAVTIESEAPPLSPEFADAYRAFDQFVPEPLPIAGLTYTRTAALLRGDPQLAADVIYQYRYDENETLVFIAETGG